MSIRKVALELASQSTSFRRKLIASLLKESRFLKLAKPSYEDYVRDKKVDQEKPLSKEDWEARVFGKSKKERKERSSPKHAPDIRQGYEAFSSGLKKIKPGMLGEEGASELAKVLGKTRDKLTGFATATHAESKPGRKKEMRGLLKKLDRQAESVSSEVQKALSPKEQRAFWRSLQKHEKPSGISNVEYDRLI